MDMAERLKKIRKNLGLSQISFADTIEEKQTKIKDIETGKQKITIDFAKKVENIHHIDFKWLLTGEGNMYADNESMPFRIINNISNDDVMNVSVNPNDYVYIPVYGDVVASAGYGVTVYNEEQTAMYAITKELAKVLNVNSQTSKIIFTVGDSMEPTISGGDCLLVDIANKQVCDGKIYCIRMDNQLLVKRLQKLPPNKIKVISDNKEKYDPFYIDLSQKIDFDFEVIGEVRWMNRIIN